MIALVGRIKAEFDDVFSGQVFDVSFLINEWETVSVTCRNKY